jgi:hypothetical protein
VGAFAAPASFQRSPSNGRCAADEAGRTVCGYEAGNSLPDILGLPSGRLVNVAGPQPEPTNGDDAGR